VKKTQRQITEELHETSHDMRMADKQVQDVQTLIDEYQEKLKHLVELAKQAKHRYAKAKLAYDEMKTKPTNIDRS
jgi:predicted  nucleic acid-binding Zn-ribbon protein